MAETQEKNVPQTEPIDPVSSDEEAIPSITEKVEATTETAVEVSKKTPTTTPKKVENGKETTDNTVLPVLKDIFSKKTTWIILLSLVVLIVVACVISSIANSLSKPSPAPTPEPAPEEEVGVKVDDISIRITELVKEAKFSVLEIPYDGLIPWQEKTEKGTDEVGYVAYHGTIKLGIDFSKIKVSAPDSDSVILVTVPEVTKTQNSMTVDDYYFTDKDMKNTYNQAGNASSLQKKLDEMCQKDMLDNYDKGGEYTEMAQNRVLNLVEQLTKPLAESRGYQVRVQFGGGSK